MSSPIYASHQSLVAMANNECGYQRVWVDHGDTARWSDRGNLVIEHNRRGTEEVCGGGRVLSGERRNYDNSSPPRRNYDNYSPPRPYYDTRRNNDAAAAI